MIEVETLGEVSVYCVFWSGTVFDQQGFSELWSLPMLGRQSSTEHKGAVWVRFLSTTSDIWAHKIRRRRPILL